MRQARQALFRLCHARLNAASIAAHTNDKPPSSPDEAAGILPLIALAALVALQTTQILTHVAWRDELQAALLAQHSHSLAALFANLHYEGHPALWYLLLRALSPLGSAPTTLKIVQLCVALSTIALVWTRAPFGSWTKLLILASYPIFFEWGTISRSYGVGVTLFFAFIAFRRHWVAYVILALMANISAHFLILSAICILMLFVLERRASALGIGIWFLGCIAAVAAALPASGVETVERLPPSLRLKVLSALESISYALIPIDPRFMPPHWTGLGAPMSAVVGLFVPIIGCFALSRNRRAAAIYLLFFAAMFALGTCLYPTATRHTAMLFLCLIGLEWMLAEDGEGRPSVLTKTWAAILVASAFWVAGWSFVAPFTPIKAITAWVKAHNDADVQWAAYPAALGVDLAANFKRPYYDPRRECLAWFQKWNAGVGEALDPNVLDHRLARAASASGGRMLLLTDGIFDATNTSELSLEATFPAEFLMETWYVYAVAAPAAAARATIPSCG